MNALAPLFGVMVLSFVLVTNFFNAAWKLGILRAFGRRRELSWQTLAAGFGAACLPFAGVILALELIPADNKVNISMMAGQLAVQLALSGLLMHVLNDKLIEWGRSTAAA